MFSTDGEASATAKPTWPKPRAGIFGRVYAFSLVLAGLAIAGCILVGQYLIEKNLKDQVHSLARWLVEQAFDLDQGASRDALLSRLYQNGRVRITLYDADGQFIGAGGPVFSLPGPVQLALLRRTREEGFDGEEAKLSVAVYRGTTLLGYGFVAPAAPFSIGFGWPQALLILATIALISWPLALSLLKPLRALSETIHRFGEGDLAARVAKPGNDEIGELAREFNRLAGRFQELLQSEKMLLAAVSHELRTPLQRVRLALDLATDGQSQTDSRHLAGVSADLDDLDELLSEILVVARLDQARSASDGLLTKIPVPPDALIAECVERFEAAHPNRTVHWLAGPPLALCQIDPRFLRRAILNLLENAARYSPQAEPIEVVASTGAENLVITIRDRGPGIAPELHARIFEPFFQGNPARGSGSGLGLSIVKRIAEAHGGTVSVDSSPAGSTFRITVPITGESNKVIKREVSAD
jgi:two-component system, OmpR family, sensor kinase